MCPQDERQEEGGTESWDHGVIEYYLCIHVDKDFGSWNGKKRVDMRVIMRKEMAGFEIRVSMWKGMIGGLVVSRLWGQEKAKCQEFKWKEVERVLTFMLVLLFKVISGRQGHIISRGSRIRSLLSRTVKIIITKMQVLVPTEQWEGVSSHWGLRKSFIASLCVPHTFYVIWSISLVERKRLIVLVWVPLGADSWTRIWVQVFCFGGYPRKWPRSEIGKGS